MFHTKTNKKMEIEREKANWFRIPEYTKGWTDQQLMDEFNKVTMIEHDVELGLSWVWVACSVGDAFITTEKVYLMDSAEPRKLEENRTAEYWYQHENKNPKML